MATTPQSVPPASEFPANRKPTREEFHQLLREIREEIQPYVPEDWDPVRELSESRRAAALAGE